MTLNQLIAIAVTCAYAVTAFPIEAPAAEGKTPYQSGISVGIPLGALPPPGFYASDENLLVIGGLRDNAGHTLWQVGMTMDPTTVNFASVQSSSLSVVVQKL